MKIWKNVVLSLVLVVVFLPCTVPASVEPDRASRLASEAESLFKRGEYRQAFAPAEEALTLRRAQLGSGHPRLVTDLLRLARVRAELAEGEASLELYGKAAELRKEAYHDGLADALALAEVLAEHGDALRRTGDYRGASSLVEEAVDLVTDEAMAREPLRVAAISHFRGLVSRELGRHADSRRALEEALALREAAAAGDSSLAVQSEIGRTLFELAFTLRLQADFRPARELGERAVALLDKTLGADHPDTAFASVRLAQVLLELVEYEKAGVLLQRALATCEAVLGSDHPETAVVLGEFAAFHAHRLEFPRARSYGDRALETLDLLWPAHPRRAFILIYVAQGLLADLDYPGARQWLEEARGILEEKLGPEHPEMIKLLGLLAMAEYGSGEIEKALRTLERALHLGGAKLRPAHPVTAMIRGQIAALRLDEGHLLAAESLARQCEGELNYTFGPRHPVVADCLMTLGGALGQQGRISEATSHFERVLLLNEGVFGAEHSSLARPLLHLSLIEQSWNRIDNARRNAERALAILHQAVGEDHPSVASVLAGLAGADLREDQIDEALQRIDLAIEILRRRLGDDALPLVSYFDTRAHILGRQGNLDAAGALLRRGLEIRRRALPKDHPGILNSLAALAQVERQQGDFSAAVARFEEVVESLQRKQRLESRNPQLIQQFRIQEFNVRQQLAEAMIDAGRLRSALAQLDEISGLIEGWQPGAHTVTVHRQLARAQRLAGDLESTRRHLREALSVLESLGVNGISIVSVLTELGLVELEFGELQAADELISRAYQIHQRTPAPDQALLVQSLRAMGILRQSQSQFQESLSLLEQALEISEGFGEAGRVAVAEVSASLGTVVAAMGQPAVAEEHFLRAFEIYEDIYGPRHRFLLDLISPLVQAALFRSDFDRARRLAERHVDIAAETLGRRHQMTAMARLSRGQIAVQSGDLAAAKADYEDALEILESKLGNDSPQLLGALESLADVCFREERLDQARSYSERMLDIAIAHLRIDHPMVLRAFSHVVFLYRSQGELDAAEERLLEVLGRYETLLGKDHTSVAHVLYLLATHFHSQSRLADARRHLQRSIEILEGSLDQDATGGSDPRLLEAQLAEARRAFGKVLFDEGDFARSRGFWEQALETTRRLYGGSNLRVAQILSDLSNLLMIQGDARHALGLAEEAQKIWNAASPAEVTRVSDGLAEAVESIADGDLGKIESYLEDLVHQYESSPPHFRPLLVSTLVSLAATKRVMEDYDASAETLERALGILETAPTRDDRQLVTVLKQLSQGEISRGNLGIAVAYQQRAVDRLAAVVRPRHPELVEMRQTLAIMRWLVDEDIETAKRLFVEAARGSKRQVVEDLWALSYSEQILLLGRLAVARSTLLSTHREGEDLANAWGLLLDVKGLLVESLQAETAVPRLAEEQGQYRRALGRLQELRRLDAAGSESTPEKEREAEDLERELRAALPEKDRLRKGLTLEELRSVLAPGEALVDVHQYLHIDRIERTEMRYAAVVLGKDFGPQLIELGEAQEIDVAILEWILDSTTRELGAERRQQELANLLWRPLEAALPGDVVRLWLSPDGETARVPWHLLASAPLAQVVSPTAFFQLRQPRDSVLETEESTLLLVGDVDFDGVVDPSGAPFAPLPGTRASVDGLLSLANEEAHRTVLLTRSHATETAVRTHLPRATWAHFDTHGFFAERVNAIEREPKGDDVFSLLESALVGPEVRNPLVESGLAFASGSADHETEDGLLTAVELLGIDCRKCQVVTLAACDTGRGRVLTGQGVHGLQSVVMASGARNLVMSLWRIPNEAAQAFSTAFYRALWKERLPPVAALKQAQEAVRGQSRFTEPLYWAPWVLVGEGFSPVTASPVVDPVEVSR